jgi:hypothetical protein
MVENSVLCIIDWFVCCWIQFTNQFFFRNICLILFLVDGYNFVFYFFCFSWICLWVDALPSLGGTHLRAHQNVVVESWDSEGAANFQHYKGVEGRATSPGIRLGRRTSRSSLILHPKHSGTPLGVGTSHWHFGPQDTPRPGLKGSHHLPPHSILCDAPLRLHPNGSFSQDSQVGFPTFSGRESNYQFDSRPFFCP